jgi:GTP-binding protein Era
MYRFILQAINTENKKSGFVLLLGETNAGKSTLLNTILGQKVAITSHKVQTTRFKILGVLNKNNNQIIFIDTPGIFKPQRKFDETMVNTSYSAISDADVVIVLLDANKGLTEKTHEIIKQLPTDKKSILVLNKADLMNQQQILNILNAVKDFNVFDKFFIISAINENLDSKKSGVADLILYLEQHLPNNHWFFNHDELSDQNMNIIASEITREQIYKYLHQEIPYNITVEAVKWDETPKSVQIAQNILVSKENYKGMVVGKGGSTIAQIRQGAEFELQKQLNKKVILNLSVKVSNKWLG